MNGAHDTPIRQARKRAGLTLEQLAVKAGIARMTLYMAERAPALASERTILRVASVLDVDPNELRTP